MSPPNVYRATALWALCLTAGGCNGVVSAPPISQPNGHSSERSWASPDVAKSLLYVADSLAAVVNVYAGNPPKLVAALAGFKAPLTMCVDGAPSQNVYIVDNGAQKIYEYAHGGTQPIKTLSDPDGYPFACSVDPTSGNLAVSNYANASGKEPGNLVIFRHARGSAHEQNVTNMSFYYFPAYDSAGDLFVDGTQSFGSPEIAEQPQGTHFWKILRFRFYYNQAVGLQWDGQYLALCDPSTNPNVIYEFSVSSGSGFLKGTTTLKGDASVFQFWIGKYGGKSRVAATDENLSDPTAEMYPYPAGGGMLFTLSGFIDPTGIVISNGAKQ